MDNQKLNCSHVAQSDSPSLTGDAFGAPLPSGPLVAVLEQEAELLGVVPGPPLAGRVQLAVEEALGHAAAHLEVDQLALALALDVALRVQVQGGWRLSVDNCTGSRLLCVRLHGPLN